MASGASVVLFMIYVFLLYKQLIVLIPGLFTFGETIFQFTQGSQSTISAAIFGAKLSRMLLYASKEFVLRTILAIFCWTQAKHSVFKFVDWRMELAMARFKEKS